MIDLVEQGAEKVGGLGKLAEGLGIRHQAFYSWKQVPPARVLDFERLTGISRYRIRPDIYGPEPVELPTAKLEAAE
ncbi:MAG TPA: Cro/CI family transcriptional regulator [Mesorhizobium sp.]|uniref:Cro/CI family transcriptional regulator n=1 Tax=Mesorhizobium sp. TaxID=1871066 RepID=UPI002DDDAB3C|nr:Cro/CI family transcriptional regulator [Mesorhizobium sp.]HEV2504427.1 Cro/CI family transcriptional regulator [Mesorhizobium sp.]